MQKILVVDDEPRLIEDMLVAYGFEVDVAVDGFMGLQTLYNAKDSYEMVILDLHMPKMDGWSFLKTVRNGEECPNVPIIMLTSADTEESLVTGLRRGADEYLIKPITPRKLLAHMEAVLRRSRREAELTRKLDDTDSKSQTTTTVLTQRESEILSLIVKGYSNNKIGEHLIISETTVKNHLAHIYRKLNVANRTEAAFQAQKLNLL